MREVILQSMKMENFKGIASREVHFGKLNCVEGANGTGKTSLYEAYLWCLFEKNADGSVFDVQPIGKDGKIIHKVETSVELRLLVDNKSVSIKRTLVEKWSKARGSNEERLTGTERMRFYDDVPCGVVEFAEKLNAICPVDDWFMLSSISAFMGMKQEDRRKKLQSISKEIKDEDLAADYPHIMQAMKDGKTVDEFRAQKKLEKDKAQRLLNEIPARIDEAEKQRVDYNFDELEKEEKDVQEKIAGIDDSLNAIVTTKDIDRAASVKAELQGVMKDILEVEDEVKRTRLNRIHELEAKKKASEQKANANREEARTRMITKERYSSRLQELQERFTSKQQEWMTINETEYVDKVEEVCPTCGQYLPSAEVVRLREKAIEDFNKKKNDSLDSIEADAANINKEIADAKSEIEKQNSEISRLNQLADSDLSIAKECDEAIKKVPEEKLALDAKIEYQNLLAKRLELERQIRIQSEPTSKEYENDAQKSSLRQQRDTFNNTLQDIRAKLSKREINRQIDKRREELEEQQKTYAQEVTDVELIEQEIRDFKKRKIELVEESVSSFFTMVRWKMYRQNLTNDGEVEICDAIIDGKPFAGQNMATRMNGGIDIINGFSKAKDIALPLFIDQKESVSNLIDTPCQLITLCVKEGSELIVTIKD